MGTRFDAIRARLVARDDKITIESASATTRNGGVVTLSGDIRLDPAGGFPGVDQDRRSARGDRPQLHRHGDRRPRPRHDRAARPLSAPRRNGSASRPSIFPSPTSCSVRLGRWRGPATSGRRPRQSERLALAAERAGSDRRDSLQCRARRDGRCPRPDPGDGSWSRCRARRQREGPGHARASRSPSEPSTWCRAGCKS